MRIYWLSTTSSTASEADASWCFAPFTHAAVGWGYVGLFMLCKWMCSSWLKFEDNKRPTYPNRPIYSTKIT